LQPLANLQTKLYDKHCLQFQLHPVVQNVDVKLYDNVMKLDDNVVNLYDNVVKLYVNVVNLDDGMKKFVNTVLQ